MTCSPVAKGCDISSRGWTTENRVKVAIPAALAAIALAIVVILILHHQGIMTSPLGTGGDTAIFTTAGGFAVFTLLSVAIGLSVHERKAKARPTLNKKTPPPLFYPPQVEKKQNSDYSSEGILTNRKKIQSIESMPWVKSTLYEIRSRIREKCFWVAQVDDKGTTLLIVKTEEGQEETFYCDSEKSARAKIETSHPTFNDESTVYKSTHFINSEANLQFSSLYAADVTFLIEKKFLKKETYWPLKYPDFTVMLYTHDGKEAHKIFYKNQPSSSNKLLPLSVDETIRQDLTMLKGKLENGFEQWKLAPLTEDDVKALVLHHAKNDKIQADALKKELSDAVTHLEINQLVEKKFETAFPHFYCLIVHYPKSHARKGETVQLYKCFCEFLKNDDSTKGLGVIYYFHSYLDLITKRAEILQNKTMSMAIKMEVQESPHSEKEKALEKITQSDAFQQSLTKAQASCKSKQFYLISLQGFCFLFVKHKIADNEGAAVEETLPFKTFEEMEETQEELESKDYTKADNA